MVADHWFMQIEKVLEAMEITSDATRIRLAAFQLKGEAHVWWKWARTSRDLEAMTWAEFQELFMGKYFPVTARHAKAQEFLELKQGAMIVMNYVARFTELVRFADDYVATDMAKVSRFENGLKLFIRAEVGIYSYFLDPTHVFSISFFFYVTVRLILDPFYRATIEYQTQCRSTMYSRHTIEHQTQCRSQPCTHTHVMQCPVHKCNAMPLHVSHATCTMNATCNNSKSYFMQSIMDKH